VQAHFHRGIDPAEDAAAVAGITRVLLATDHAGVPGRLRTVPSGDGEINVQGVLATLVAEGFDGAVIAARLGVLGAARIDTEMKRAYAHLAAIRAQVTGAR
jgi:sugar phosphate isomerase/epimerase